MRNSEFEFRSGDLELQESGGILTRIAMARERGGTRDENGWMARFGMVHRRGHGDGKGERGRQMAKARSGRHLAGRPESRDKDPSLRHPPGRRRLAGKMPARAGRMPALPRNATLQSLPQFPGQRRRDAENGKRTDFSTVSSLFFVSAPLRLCVKKSPGYRRPISPTFEFRISNFEFSP